MDAPTQTAIGPRDYTLAPQDLCVPDDPVRYHLRMLDNVGGVANDARDEQFILGQCDLLPDTPFVFVANIAGFDGICSRLNAQHEIDDVPQRNIGRMRPVPTAQQM